MLSSEWHLLGISAFIIGVGFSVLCKDSKYGIRVINQPYNQLQTCSRERIIVMTYQHPPSQSFMNNNPSVKIPGNLGRHIWARTFNICKGIN